MVVLLLLIAVLFVVAMLFVWSPFYASNLTSKSATLTRFDENKALYQEKLNQLEKELTSASISEAEFNERKQELALTLLDDTKIKSSGSIDKEGHIAHKSSLIWPVSISVIVMLLSSFMYSKTGAYALVTGEQSTVEATKADSANANSERIRQIEELETLVKQEPSNSQAWFSLGYMYLETEQYKQSLQAFEKVEALVGQHAEIIGGRAQATYYASGQEITSEVQLLIDKAFSIDPLDPATNILLGMHNFKNKEFQQAISHWQRVIRSPREDIFKQGLINSITQAQKQLGYTAIDYAVTVTANLSPSLLQYTNPDDTVFIYAHMPGQRMPLAIQQVTVADLPVDIRLDDGNAMSPTAKLSYVDKVVVKALVSKSSTAGVKPGDLVGESVPVDTFHSQPVHIEIDTLVKDNTNSAAYGVTVSLSISDEMREYVKASDTVFIFAAPSEGERIPLTAMKVKVSELPTTVRLQDKQGEQALLATAGVVDIHALVTSDSQAGFGDGTPRGVVSNINVSNTSDPQVVTLEINERVSDHIKSSR